MCVFSATACIKHCIHSPSYVVKGLMSVITQYIYIHVYSDSGSHLIV